MIHCNDKALINFHVYWILTDNKVCINAIFWLKDNSYTILAFKLHYVLD